MRSLPKDSPQAAARLLCLILIADGDAAQAEFEVLERLGAAERLGLDREALQGVLRQLCEDLHCGERRRWGRTVDLQTFDALLAELESPVLRAQVLQLAYAVAIADRRLSDGEAELLARANRRWRPEDWAIAA